MHPVLKGQDADNSYSVVPFEKGFQLLQFIEDSIIGYNYMQDFIQYYLFNNALTNID